MAIILAPYLKGKGPRLKIDLDSGWMIAYPGKGKKSFFVFEWEPSTYRPGLGVHTQIQEAEDVLSFVIAYVDRPGEFGRERSEKGAFLNRHWEQVRKKWWREHGEAMQAEAMFRAEKVGRGRR